MGRQEPEIAGILCIKISCKNSIYGWVFVLMYQVLIYRNGRIRCKPLIVIAAGTHCHGGLAIHQEKGIGRSGNSGNSGERSKHPEWLEPRPLIGQGRCVWECYMPLPEPVAALRATLGVDWAHSSFVTEHHIYSVTTVMTGGFYSSLYMRIFKQVWEQACKYCEDKMIGLWEQSLVRTNLCANKSIARMKALREQMHCEKESIVRTKALREGEHCAKTSVARRRALRENKTLREVLWEVLWEVLREVLQEWEQRGTRITKSMHKHQLVSSLDWNWRRYINPTS